MLGGSGGKYWGAARTPLPPPPSLSRSLSLSRMCIGVFACAQQSRFSVASPVISLTPVAAHAFA